MRGRLNNVMHYAHLVYQGFIWSQLKMTKFKTNRSRGGTVRLAKADGTMGAAQTPENASLSGLPRDAGKSWAYRQATGHKYGLPVCLGCGQQVRWTSGRTFTFQRPQVGP